MGYCRGSPKGKYIAIQASLKRIEKMKMRFLYSHLKKLEQQQRDRSNSLTRKQWTKIRAEIKELETRSTVEQINRTRSWFFERAPQKGELQTVFPNEYGRQNPQQDPC